jgi:hypothetical protein
MRRVRVLALFLLAGCASAYRIQPIELAATGAPVTLCYVHYTHDTEIVDTRLVGFNGVWAVTGDVRGLRFPLPYRQRVKVEAVEANETLVLATMSPARVENHDESWSFHLPIPAPASFDHLHLAVVSAEEAFFALPPHALTHQ